MKLALEHHGIVVEVSVPQDDLNLGQATAMFAMLLVGAGYSEALVDKMIPGALKIEFETAPTYRIDVEDK